MSINTKDIDKTWKKLGFGITDSRDRFARLVVDGKLILTTLRSLGGGKLPGNIPHLIRQQMKLNDSQFRDAIACPLGRKEYLEILRQKGLL